MKNISCDIFLSRIKKSRQCLQDTIGVGGGERSLVHVPFLVIVSRVELRKVETIQRSR